MTTMRIFTKQQILKALPYFSSCKRKSIIMIHFVANVDHPDDKVVFSKTIPFKSLEIMLDYYVSRYGDKFTNVNINGCPL